jgi:addiction module HigA family antidote
MKAGWMTQEDGTDGSPQPVHPGAILQTVLLGPTGLAASDLARAIGMSAEQVDGVLTGRSRLEAEMALLLGRYFDVDPAWCLGLQMTYDLEVAPRAP